MKLNLIQRIAVSLAFGKRSVSTLSNPADWFFDMMTDQRSETGVSVTEKTSLQCAAVLACVRVLSETIAALPYLMYRRTPDGKQRANDHPLFYLLKNQANTEMTAYTWKLITVTHAALYGNAYSAIERNNAGYVSGLWPLQPAWMQIRRNGGALEYIYTTESGTQTIFQADEIFHLKPMTLDGVTGISFIKYAKESVGLALAEERFGAKFFGNGTNMGGYFEHPATISEEAYNRLSKDVKARYSGLENAQKTAILEEGMKFNKITVPPNDAQFLESRKFQIAEIARIFRVPAHLVNDLDKATFSNIEQLGLEFVQYTMQPWAVNFEQETAMKLLTPAENREYFAEFMMNSLLRGDIKARYEAYAIGRNNGWLSANDIRELENLNQIDGGNEYLSPLNMIPASKLSEYYAYLKNKQGGNTNAQ